MRDRSVKPIGIAATNASQQFFTGPARLMGWALRETTGAAGAQCDLYDGNDATGGLVVPFTFNANESVRDWLGPNGVLIQRGGFLNMLAGSVKGTLFAELLPDEASFYDLIPQGGEGADVSINVQ